MNSSAPGEIAENVKIARDCSMLGNYETALIYYQGVVQQIHRHLQAITDPQLREKWQEVSVCLFVCFEIEVEHHLTTKLSLSLSLFCVPFSLSS